MRVQLFDAAGSKRQTFAEIGGIRGSGKGNAEYNREKRLKRFDERWR